MDFFTETHISPIANKLKRQSVDPPEHGELSVASIDDFEKPYNKWKSFSLFSSPFDQRHLPDPPEDSPDSSTSFQEESQESVEIRFTIEPSGLYNEEHDTSSIEVSNMDRTIHEQDCSYYKTPQMVMDDSRSIGQVMFMSLSFDEYSFWVKSS